MKGGSTKYWFRGVNTCSSKRRLLCCPVYCFTIKYFHNVKALSTLFWWNGKTRSQNEFQLITLQNVEKGWTNMQGTVYTRFEDCTPSTPHNVLTVPFPLLHPVNDSSHCADVMKSDICCVLFELTVKLLSVRWSNLKQQIQQINNNLSK